MRLERDQIQALLIAVILSAAFIGIVWLPRYLHVLSLHARLAVALQQSQSERPSPTALNQLAKDVRDYKTQLSTMSRRVSKASQMPEILGVLSNSLTKESVLDQEIQTQPKVLNAEFTNVPVNLRFRSKFNSAYGIVRLIENNPNLLRVDKLDLLSDASVPGSEPLHVTMEVSAVLEPEGVVKP